MLDFIARHTSRRAAIAVLLAGAVTSAAACGGDSNGPTATGNDPDANVVPEVTETRQGGTLKYVVANSGDVTLRLRPCVVALQRLVTASWTNVDLPTDWRDCTASAQTLAPGASEKVSIRIPFTLLAGGVYRVALDMTAKLTTGDVPLVAYSTSFTVFAR